MDIVRIATVCTAVDTATRALFAATEQEIEADYELRTARMVALLNGEVAGKNEMEREAGLRRYLPDLHDRVLRLQSLTRTAKLQLDLANLAMSRLRMELRAEELAQRTAPEEWEA